MSVKYINDEIGKLLHRILLHKQLGNFDSLNYKHLVTIRLHLKDVDTIFNNQRCKK